MPFLCAQLDEAFFHYPQRIDMQIFAGIGNLSDLEVLTDCLSYACSLIIGMHSNTGCIRCILFIRLYAKGSNHGMV